MSPCTIISSNYSRIHGYSTRVTLTGFEPVIPAWETDDLNQSVPRAIYKAVIPISSNLIICLSDDPDLCELLLTNNSLYVERLMGVEPTSLAWKASIIAVIRQPQIYSCNRRTKYFKDPHSWSNSILQQGIMGGGILSPSDIRLFFFEINIIELI